MAVVVSRGGIFAASMTLLALAGCTHPRGGAPAGAARGLADDPRADGAIVSVNRPVGEVYINLGRKDHVREGMTFEAFERRRGITLEADRVRPARGAATLEVTQVGEAISLCRIVRSTSRELAEGDLIRGYDYAKGFEPVFVIEGDFDLDGDGAATAADRERLEGIVRAWGGTIEPALSAHTNYLIMGTRPPSPATEDAQPQPGDIFDHRTAEQKHYDQQLENARTYAIPVLNLNRTLYLTGAQARTVTGQ